MSDIGVESSVALVLLQTEIVSNFVLSINIHEYCFKLFIVELSSAVKRQLKQTGNILTRNYKLYYQIFDIKCV